MKKILTAIGNPMLNSKIKEMGKYQVLTEDLKNDEELIEWLEKSGEIDLLFLCSNIIHHYAIKEFIEIIQKIQKNIFILFFKGENIEINIQKTDRLKIYKTIDFDSKILDEITEEIEVKNNKKYASKIISISGTNGIGKSTFSAFLSKNIKIKNMKVLLIDFDLDQNQIRTILKIKKQPQYFGDIKNMVITVNKNLDVLCHLDMVFSTKNNIDFFKIQEIFNQLKKEYNLIIIDTSSKLENEYTKRIFYNSDNIIFLLEPNILGIKKSQIMLEVFENDWGIPHKKINLILNKTNIYQISNCILEEIFPNFLLLGKIQYNDVYNLIINKNIDKKEVKNQYEKIYKKIIKIS